MAIALFVILFDQLTKLAVMHYLPFNDGVPIYNLNASVKPIEVVKNFFYIVHITNEGAAWGIFSGQIYMLSSIAIATLAGIWLFRRQIGLEHIQMQFAMGFFSGGIIGNLLDRICYGHVVDFLDVHLPIVNYRWPAFNVADCAIAIGVGLYIIVSLMIDSQKKKELESGQQKWQNGIDGK